MCSNEISNDAFKTELLTSHEILLLNLSFFVYDINEKTYPKYFRNQSVTDETDYFVKYLIT